MSFKASKTLFICLVCFVLSACAGTGGKPLPVMTFSHLEPISISVGAVRSASEEQGIAEAFVVSPSRALEEYIHARFLPAGFAGLLQATTEEASIAHSYEPSDSRVGQALDVNGWDVYDMVIKVRLEHLDDHGDVLYGTVLTARRVIKVTEHSSVAERERRQFEAVEALFQDLDKQIMRIVLEDMRLAMP